MLLRLIAGHLTLGQLSWVPINVASNSGVNNVVTYALHVQAKVRVFMNGSSLSLEAIQLTVWNVVDEAFGCFLALPAHDG